MNTKSWMRLSQVRVAAVLACGLLLGAGGAALAASGSGTSTTALASVQQTTRTYAAGPEAYEERGPSDIAGGHGGVDPLPITMPKDASAYDALVTVTFRYRTTGKGPFSFGLYAGTKVFGKDQTKRPASPWPLAASAVVDSASVQFVVPALKAGTQYYFAPTADTAVPRKTGKSGIKTDNVVMTVQLTPRPS